MANALCMQIWHRPVWWNPREKRSLAVKLHRKCICCFCQAHTSFLSQLFAKMKTVLNGVSQTASLVSFPQPLPKNLLQNNIPSRYLSFCPYKNCGGFSEQKPMRSLFRLLCLNSAWSTLSQKPVKIKLYMLLHIHAYTYICI